MITTDAIVFSKEYKGLGTITIRPFQIKKDSVFLQQWVTQEYAFFGGCKTQQ
nr:hypothetical protein BACY1_10680 [Tenacibaculum mesophilum]